MTHGARLSELSAALESRFSGRQEAIRAMLVSVVAGEHMLLVGPPGTGKSALVRSLARMLDARSFEYLLTRFSEPNELFGPIDIQAFRAGVYKRNTAGMLPEAEIVFLDEVFKASSAILNALLSLLNERTITVGREVIKCPLVSVIGATNESPDDPGLAAVFDRFLLRVRTEHLEAYHFDALLQRGIAQEIDRAGGGGKEPRVPLDALRTFERTLRDHLELSPSFVSTYKSLVFQIRAEGIAFSDRRAVKMLKLFAASAWVDGRSQPDDGDLGLLAHVWSREEEIPILNGLLSPVLEAHARRGGAAPRVGAVSVGIEALSAEIERIRRVLTEGAPPSDVQLFSQLRSLSEVRAMLSTLEDPRARELEKRATDLLEASFRTGRFAAI